MKIKHAKRSYCRFCLSFCGIKINFDASGVPIQVIGDTDHPISKGYTCKKGRSLLDFYSKDRLLHPMRFGNTRVSWEDALGSLGDTIKDIIVSHGPNAIALYAGGNATLDATGMWTALGFMYRIRSNNIYTVSSVDAINKQLVVENMTSNATVSLIPLIDFDRTDCLLLVGSNPIVSHGHLAGIPYPGKKIRDIMRRGGAVIAVDPRLTATAKRATLHIRPLPGSDYAWLAYVIHELLAGPVGSGVDYQYLSNHTQGLTELKMAVAYFNKERTCRITGLDTQSLDRLVLVIKKAENFSAVTGTGVSFSDAGIVGEWFLWALLAIKGKLDRSGGVWFNPGLTSKDASIKSVNTISHTTAFHMRMPARQDLPAKVGENPCAGLIDEILANNIKVLICLGGNPLNSFPNSDKTASGLAKLDALVVLDTHKNDLVNLAHFSLPVCGQLERADSTIYAQSSVPMLSVQFTQKVLEPAGEVKPAWWVFSKLGEVLGLDTVNLSKSTEQLDDVEVLKTIKGGRALFDSTSLIYNGFFMKREKPVGWVVDTVLPDNRWRLHSPILASELYRVLARPHLTAKFQLVSMREDDHINTQFTQGPKANILPQVRIHEFDALEHGLLDGSLVRLHSAYGVMIARVKISEEAKQKTVCIPHGYRLQGNVSNLTSEVLNVNPLSSMVTQTGIPINIEKM